MSDQSIRQLTPQERADRAFAEYLRTGEEQPNPYTEGSREHMLFSHIYSLHAAKHVRDMEAV